ncbi:MAG TPA: glycosyltransferase family 4 protein [Burkholderiales bacterium]|nr:glycosyltransferase family 4 protein [Burkholderiales bacterium]
MNIVHTESSLGWGGQELRILSEAQGLARRGHQLTLLCPPEARIFGEAPNWGLRAVAVPIARKRPAGLMALRSWFAANRADVVSTHSSTDSWLSALALASLGKRIPMVRTRHISAPVPRNAFSRWLYARPARIVTTGVALRRDLIASTGVPPERVDSVPTGADPARYKPGDRSAARASVGLPADKMLIGIVATLRSWKGHRYLVEALPENATLVVVGDGPQREALQGRAAELGVLPRVIFAGNQRDVVPWLQALDVFALPSYANEGVPQALLQAMLTGLPCVTTEVGSIAELAINERTALLVPPKDVAALRSALERLLADEPLRRTLGDAARTHCAESMSAERMLDRMEAIYSEASAAI